MVVEVRIKEGSKSAWERGEEKSEVSKIDLYLLVAVNRINYG